MNVENLTNILTSHNIKPTSNRILILNAIVSSEKPISLLELENEIETVDKSNIFRTLILFKDKHLVHTINDSKNSIRYEICNSHNDELDSDTHVHFHCEKCNQIFCLSQIAIPNVTLPENYTMETVNFIIYGTCPNCNKKQKSTL